MSQLSNKDKILHYLRNMDVLWLARMPILFAFIQLMAWGFIKEVIFDDFGLGLGDYIFWIVFMLTFSLRGFAYIWKGERYGFARNPFRRKLIRGRSAVIFGIFYVVSIWGLMLFVIVFVFYLPSLN